MAVHVSLRCVFAHPTTNRDAVTVGNYITYLMNRLPCLPTKRKRDEGSQFLSKKNTLKNHIPRHKFQPCKHKAYKADSDSRKKPCIAINKPKSTNCKKTLDLAELRPISSIGLQHNIPLKD